MTEEILDAIEETLVSGQDSQPASDGDGNTSGPTADSVLQGAVGKFPAVLVIGIHPNQTLEFATNVPQYPWMQYILNKASFELFIHERNKDD